MSKYKSMSYDDLVEEVKRLDIQIIHLTNDNELINLEKRIQATYKYEEHWKTQIEKHKKDIKCAKYNIEAWKKTRKRLIARRKEK